jgi:hypothetical protein
VILEALKAQIERAYGHTIKEIEAAIPEGALVEMFGEPQ